jgi:serine/threonine protein kinase
MSITVGSRIGTFEIAEPLGAGGMGEVYRAHDTRLGRDVAIKVLPPSFAADADRRARFEREARVLASLNHPHIATLYGIEESPAGPVLVMELIDGDTLADRLALSGPLAVREVLTIAKQVAAALEAAHQQGIIHRDLKPANIKITPDRRVKVLDFGIAKAVAGRKDDETQTIAGATETGVIVGTPAYMSPEQARGETLGVQSDVWSFGAVLYEMLTGASPFKRKTSAETIAHVLESPPDYGALPAGTPDLAARLVQRCLERDPSGRLQHMGDVRILVEEALTSLEPAAATGSASSVRRRGPWIASGLVAAALAGVAIGTLAVRSAPTAPTSPLYVSVPFQGGPVSFPFGTRHLAIAPDGSTVAFASNRGLQIRHIDQNARAVISTGGNNPFFSPDGDWVGLFVEAPPAIVKVPVRGGTAVTITALTDRPFGASWRSDGTIVFATTEGLFEIAANGGEPKVIVRPERGRGEKLYAWPHFLPDGRSILYTALSADGNDGPQTILLDLKSHERKALVRGSSAVYAASGRLVYSAGSTLNAVAFNAATGALTGRPAAIPGIDVATSTDDGMADFAISETGSVIFLAPTVVAKSTFEWIDRRGQREPLNVEPQNYGYAVISPDGTRVAVERWTNGKRNIWILDLRRLTQTQLTDGPIEDMLPVWSADGQRVFFASNRGGNFDVYSQAADGASSAALVFAAPGLQAPSATTPDGTRLLIYDKFDDLAILNLAKPDHLQPLLHSGFDERLGEISADGRWIAYESNESGNQFEIILRSFPDVSARREIVSINGGRYPRWGPKGLDELYYLSADGAMMAVPITLSPALALGMPKKLFDWQKPVQGRSGLRYDVAPDGRFLVPKAQAPSPEIPTNVSLIINWLADLRHAPRQ